jgi:hypothetical protein
VLGLLTFALPPLAKLSFLHPRFPWSRGTALMSPTHMEGLAKHGLLRMRTTAMEWLVPSHEEVPAPPNGYVMSFML